MIFMKRRRSIDSMEDAMNLGLRLKPACQSHEANARGLIEKLGIA